MRGESIVIFERWKNIGNLWFSSFPCKHPPDHPPIFLISAKVLSAKPRPQTQTRRHYDAMSSCKPKSIFFVRCWFFLCSMDVGVHFFRGPCVTLVKNMITPPTPTPLLTIREHVQHVNNGSLGPCVIFVQTLSHPPTPNPLVDHKRACATSATS